MKNSKRGMTLVELLVSMVISVIVIGGASALLFTVMDNFQTTAAEAKDRQNVVLAEKWLRDTADTAKSAAIENKLSSGGTSFFFEKGVLQSTDTSKKTVDMDGTEVPMPGIKELYIKISAGVMVGQSVLKYTITGKNGYAISGGIVLNNAESALAEAEAAIKAEDATAQYLNFQF